MAKDQRPGAPHAAEDVAWVNTTLFDEGCGSLAHYNGWCAELFFDPDAAIEPDSRVADVHTQPADEQGASVERVLHVGTGWPRAMIVTIDGCTGPRP